MTIETGQIYKDLDPRFQGRTLKVLGHSDALARPAMAEVTLEVLSNANDVQGLLDDPDGQPGTRGYKPKDRRGKTTTIKASRLQDPKLFELVEQDEDSE